MTAPPSDSMHCTAHRRWWRQFSLRELFAEVTLLAVVFGLLRFGFSPYPSPLGIIAVLAATPIIPAWIGAVAPPFWGVDRPDRRREFAVFYATCAAAAVSPIIVAMEWGRDHPWPASDAPYVLLSIARCLMTGCAIGWLVSAWLDLASGAAGRRVQTRLSAQKLFAAAPFVVALLLLWLSTAPWYRQKSIIGQLGAAIETGTSEDVAIGVDRLDRITAKAEAVGTIWFKALHAPKAQVRIRALQALKLFGDAADEAKPSLKPLPDEDAGVRKAAADLIGDSAGSAQPRTDGPAGAAVGCVA